MVWGFQASLDPSIPKTPSDCFFKTVLVFTKPLLSLVRCSRQILIGTLAGADKMVMSACEEDSTGQIHSVSEKSDEFVNQGSVRLEVCNPSVRLCVEEVWLEDAGVILDPSSTAEDLLDEGVDCVSSNQIDRIDSLVQIQSSVSLVSSSARGSEGLFMKNILPRLNSSLVKVNFEDQSGLLDFLHDEDSSSSTKTSTKTTDPVVFFGGSLNHKNACRLSDTDGDHMDGEYMDWVDGIKDYWFESYYWEASNLLQPWGIINLDEDQQFPQHPSKSQMKGNEPMERKPKDKNVSKIWKYWLHHLLIMPDEDIAEGGSLSYDANKTPSPRTSFFSGWFWCGRWTVKTSTARETTIIDDNHNKTAPVLTSFVWNSGSMRLDSGSKEQGF